MKARETLFLIVVVGLFLASILGCGGLAARQEASAVISAPSSHTETADYPKGGGPGEGQERKGETSTSSGSGREVKTSAKREGEQAVERAEEARREGFRGDVQAGRSVTLDAMARPRGGRRFNAFFENEQLGDVDPVPLELNRVYQLVAYLGLPRTRGLFPAERPNLGLANVLERKEASRVEIVLDCAFCAAKERHQAQTISVPPDGDSDHARFRVVPVSGTSGDTADSLVMRIEERGELIQSFVVRVKIGSRVEKEAAAPSARAAAVATPSHEGGAERATAPTALVAARFATSVETDLTEPPVNPDLVIEFDTSRRKIIFSGVVIKRMPGARDSIVCDGVGEKDYEALATQVVDRLYDLRQRSTFRFDDSANESLRNVKLNDVSRRAVLVGFARLGNAMYRQLFASSPQAIKILTALRGIAGSPKVYIKSPNGYFPWALIYDGPASKLNADSVDPEGFWGSRYVLVGVPLDRIEQRPITRELKFSELRVLIGFYAGDEAPFPGYRTAQRDYWLKPNRPAPIGEVLSEDDLLSKLHEVRDSLSALYVYAHGQNGVQKVQAKYKDTDQVVEFSRPDPSGSAIRLSPLRFQRLGLTPDDLLVLNIDDARLAGALVFLNVCNGESTGAVSQKNFVPAFLSVGAGAVIATDAEVDQGVAAAFAQDFFDEMASRGGDTTIAEIMFVLRRKYLPHNPLVYAYTLWGNGTVKREKSVATH